MTEPETTRPSRPHIGHLRYLIVFMLFIASSVNYADRSTLAAAKQGLTKDFSIDIKAFSTITLVWGIAYVLAQIPSGRLLDKFGSKKFTVFRFLSGRFSFSCTVLSHSCRMRTRLRSS